MQQRIIGQSNISASILGFGCMRLPLLKADDPRSVNYDLATAMLRWAIDAGVNYVDTAWAYHGYNRVDPGEGELFVGRALADGYRERVALTTKMPSWLVKSRRDMDRLLDAQLKRLGTPYLDFYLMHNLNSLVWPAIKDLGLFDFFDEARRDGRIKNCGFSFHDRYPVFEDIVTSYDWQVAQIQYNYMDEDYQAGRRGLKLAACRGLGVVIMEPLRGGFLVNHVPEDLQRMLAGLRPGWSLASWGLRWLWNQPEVSLVLSGMSAMEQVDDNLASAQTVEPLTGDDLAALGRVSEFFRQRLKINCTRCGYCLPCPEGVNIPKNFSYYNDYFLADDEVVRSRAKMFFKNQVAPHETFVHCAHCGRCEERCPQNLPISSLMEEVGTVLEAHK